MKKGSNTDRSQAVVLSILAHLMLLVFLLALNHIQSIVQKSHAIADTNSINAEVRFNLVELAASFSTEPDATPQREIPLSPNLQMGVTHTVVGKSGTETQSNQAVNAGANPTAVPALHPPLHANKKVVYLLDASASMSVNQRWFRAVHSLCNALKNLDETTQWQIFVYRGRSEILPIISGYQQVSPDLVSEIQTKLMHIQPAGTTSHLLGLRQGLLQQPDVLFLISDGTDLTNEQIALITKLNQGKTAIYPMLINSEEERITRQIERLALTNRGRVGYVPQFAQQPTIPGPVPR